MAGLNAFFAKALSMLGEGAARLSTGFGEGPAWNAIKNTATRRMSSGNYATRFAGMRRGAVGFPAMKEIHREMWADQWANAVAANPALSSTPLAKNGLPRVSLGEYFLGGMIQGDKIRRLAAGPGADLTQFGSTKSALVRMGVAGAMGIPMVSSALFGGESAISGMFGGVRNIGINAAVGVGLGAMRPWAGVGYLGLSGMNMLRGTGYSPLATFGR